MTEADLEEYPGMAGTGFIARREDKLFYITARHCLTKDHKVDVGALAGRLHIPFNLKGETVNSSDYVHFEYAISLKHESNDLPGELIDLLVLKIATPSDQKQRKCLLMRAVKLPPSGQWLDKFFSQPVVQDGIHEGKGPKFIAIGYPKEGTSSEIFYPGHEGEKLTIQTQPAKIHGYLAQGAYPDRYQLTGVNWKHDLNGFSGSPVFVAYKNGNGHQYGLAGMMATGGNGLAQFIKISVIAPATL
ncbi:hypothetical protein MTR01_16895 [Burkholderia thailandensis]|uniref:hypothetical protein n=1 Tax=Burkholderia thailandensis TaxID=57975 RepID=UPI0022AC41EC|nr:hypothetical protein [Burkholderia thailandensis]MCZ2895701.1 hypothetical protein [Burkholderia thailandensis]